MKFSERQGYVKVRDAVQYESMDAELKNALWNIIMSFAEANKDTFYIDFLQRFWVLHLKQQTDTCPKKRYGYTPNAGWFDYQAVLKSPFFDSEWFEVFDILEFCEVTFRQLFRTDKFAELCNIVLEKEVSAYRFFEGKIAPITDEMELQSLQNTVDESASTVGAHLQRSLDLLSDRQEPDYRNSIKEAISAVESQVRLMLIDEKGTLGNLLNKIDGLHPAQKEAFQKLYGYTSDKGGIRHALLDEDEIDFIDAKYMLVVCSAFINYLTGKQK